MNVLFKRNKLQQLRLFLSVDDFPHMLTGEFAVLDFELVGKDVVDAQFAFEEVAEIGEAARQNGGAVAVFFEGLKEALGPFGKRETVGHFLHHAFVQAFKQRHALLKTFVEVDFATHSGFGNGTYLLVNPRLSGQFINNLSLNKGRVHIKTHQTAVAAVDVVFLKRDVHAGFSRNVDEGRFHAFNIAGCAAHPKLHHTLVLFAIVQGNTAADATDQVDVESLLGNEAGDFKKQVFQDGRGFRFFGHLQEDAQTQVLMDNGLTNVQDVDIVFGQNIGQGSCNARFVLTGNVQQDDFSLFGHGSNAATG